MTSKLLLALLGRLRTKEGEALVQGHHRSRAALQRPQPGVWLEQLQAFPEGKELMSYLFRRGTKTGAALG